MPDRMPARSVSGPGHVARLLDDLSRARSAVPVAALEELIQVGAPAIPPLLEALEGTEADDDDWTPLWIAMALGELRSPAAAPALLRLLDLPEGDVLSEAAAEALAKIGRPALPHLFTFSRAASRWEARHYAYGAIGMIPAPEARDFLVQALSSDVLLWSTLAAALADQGDPAALPVLRSLLPRCDEPESPAVREAIGILEGRQPPHPKLHEKDWRTRYYGILDT